MQLLLQILTLGRRRAECHPAPGQHPHPSRQPSAQHSRLPPAPPGLQGLPVPDTWALSIHGLPSPVDTDKLRPFATNLGNPFTRTGHRPAAGFPAASRGPFAVPPRSSSLLRSQGALLATGSPRTLRPRTPGDQSTADRRFSVPNRRKVALLLPSFAGYTLEPVTASQIPKRNEKRTK